MVLINNKKAESMSWNKIAAMTIIVISLLVISFDVGSKYLGENGFGNSIGDLSDTQCQFSPELCENTKVDSNRIICDLDRSSFGPLTFDVSNYDLELKKDYTEKFSSKLSFQEITELENLAEELGMEPIHLFAVINFESGFSTSIENGKNSGATGLIQFMPSTAKNLGTTTEELSKMNFFEQLMYVEKYFKQFNGRNYDSLDKVYMDVLYPRAYGKGLDYVLFTNECSKAYEQNRGLDTNEDGYVIVAEAVSMVVKKYNS